MSADNIDGKISTIFYIITPGFKLTFYHTHTQRLTLFRRSVLFVGLNDTPP
jgi:hypothetical protein